MISPEALPGKVSVVLDDDDTALFTHEIRRSTAQWISERVKPKFSRKKTYNDYLFVPIGIAGMPLCSSTIPKLSIVVDFETPDQLDKFEGQKVGVFGVHGVRMHNIQRPFFVAGETVLGPCKKRWIPTFRYIHHQDSSYITKIENADKPPIFCPKRYNKACDIETERVNEFMNTTIHLASRFCCDQID